ncbi:MAG TPA: glycosyl hydrolase family 8 [Lachnospiraceae bacterium]|nr:glycosyl hydrolase family 8 [Lachnospiraceae bacterium]
MIEKSREYRNVFLENGYAKEDIRRKVENTFMEIFYGKEKFFHLTEDETMGYMEDTGNHDVRTEGMSYGMMVCVQLDRKKEFDCLWKWAKRYMYMDQGRNAGYFAWSVSPEGVKNSYGPAPDGEEYFAMALFFASHRWGDGEGIFQYSLEAKKLLYSCVHKGEDGIGRAMWDPQNYLIRFIPECDFTDPSYHLPHFYELFSRWAWEIDRPFWKKAAAASREFLRKACDPVTGLSAEYSTFDGIPYTGDQELFGRHDWYYSDAYRTIANIALDYEWFSKETEYGVWCEGTAEKLQKFFCETAGRDTRAVYTTDGRVLAKKALHPVAITAVNAQASLAAGKDFAKQCVEEFWNTPLRSGARRYYDNFLYLFSMLALSGSYRMW